MDSLAFAVYSRAADLRNGLPWYAFLGIFGPILTIAAAAVTNLQYGRTEDFSIALDVASLLSIAHTGSTALAVPNMLKIGRTGNDVALLDSLYKRFRLWNGVRALLQGLTLLASLVAINELLFG